MESALEGKDCSKERRFGNTDHQNYVHSNYSYQKMNGSEREWAFLIPTYIINSLPYFFFLVTQTNQLVGIIVRVPNMRHFRKGNKYHCKVGRDYTFY